MIRARVAIVLSILVAALALAPAASAMTPIQKATLASGTNGIALGPDGNFWVAEEFNNSVARVAPNGTVLTRFAVGGTPIKVDAGTNGSVWVTVSSANKLVWFDATAATPSVHNVPVSCAPVGIDAGSGNGRVYYTLPACGQIGYVNAADGTGGATSAAVFGDAFDITYGGGELYVPAFTDDAVRRANPTTLAYMNNVGTTGGPNAVVYTGSELWVTLYNTGQVAKFAGTQTTGAATVVPTPGVTLSNPIDIALDDAGRIWVASKGNGTIASIASSGSMAYTVAGSQPAGIAIAGDGFTPWFTDNATTAVRSLLKTPPVLTVAEATNVKPTSFAFSVVVDPQFGGAADAMFEYGTSTAYGQLAGSFATPAVGTATWSNSIGGLTPGTTYHFRFRSSNADGAVVSEDHVVTTPLFTMNAQIAIKAAAIGKLTKISSFRLANLPIGSTVTVTCASKKLGCPFAKKTYKTANVLATKRNLDKLFPKLARLKGKAVLKVTVTKPGYLGRSLTLTTRAGKKPLVVKGCLTPAGKPAKCG